MNTSTTCGLCLTNKVDQFIESLRTLFCSECKDRLNKL